MLPVADPIVGSFERILAHMVAEDWSAFASALSVRGSAPRFSGIVPLGRPDLDSTFGEEGVFLIIGPVPSLRVLHVGVARETIHEALCRRVKCCADGSFSWRWEEESDPPPTYVAGVLLGGRTAYAAALQGHLRRLFEPWSVSVPGGQEHLRPRPSRPPSRRARALG